MNFHEASYKYTFNNNPKNPIKVGELAQLLPLLIDAWRNLNTDEIIITKKIPLTSTLHTEISKFFDDDDGLKRLFPDQEQAMSLSVSRSDEITFATKPPKLFDPQNDITVDEIVQLLSLLVDAWKGFDTYEPVNHKKIPHHSALHQQINNSGTGIWRHFKPVTKDTTEISFSNYGSNKYFFKPEKDITAYDIAQILPILIEAWTNRSIPDILVQEKKILSSLNDKIDNLPEKTKKDCFSVYPDLELGTVAASST